MGSIRRTKRDGWSLAGGAGKRTLSCGVLSQRGLGSLVGARAVFEQISEKTSLVSHLGGFSLDFLAFSLDFLAFSLDLLAFSLDFLAFSLDFLAFSLVSSSGFSSAQEASPLLPVQDGTPWWAASVRPGIRRGRSAHENRELQLSVGIDTVDDRSGSGWDKASEDAIVPPI